MTESIKIKNQQVNEKQLQDLYHQLTNHLNQIATDSQQPIDRELLTGVADEMVGNYIHAEQTLDFDYDFEDGADGFNSDAVYPVLVGYWLNPELTATLQRALVEATAEKEDVDDLYVRFYNYVRHIDIVLL